jgi:nicotinamide riboside transporter PnuC
MTWIANVFIVIGLILAGSKNRLAFGFTLVGEIIWSIVAASKGMWDLATICLIFSILASINLYRWNRENK